MELKTFITLKTKARRARKWFKKYKAWIGAGAVAFLIGMQLGLNYAPKAGAYEGYKTTNDVLRHHRSVVRFTGENNTGSDSRLYWMHRQQSYLYITCHGLRGHTLRLCGNTYKDWRSYERKLVEPKAEPLEDGR